MKDSITSLIIMFLFGAFFGMSLCSLLLHPKSVKAGQSRVCDSLEEARLKMALAECSDAAMACAWGEDYKETILEEE